MPDCHQSLHLAMVSAGHKQVCVYNHIIEHSTRVFFHGVFFATLDICVAVSFENKLSLFICNPGYIQTKVTQPFNLQIHYFEYAEYILDRLSRPGEQLQRKSNA